MASKASKTDQQKCPSPGTATRSNQKQCAQCDQLFKKNQRSMNCNVCSYWFCLDCSHVSGKLYDVLRNETTPNLPFNCDGCLRLLPKLNEIGLKLESHSKQLIVFDRKFQDIEESINEKVNKRVEIAIEEFREREERKLNIIVHNIPEPTNEDKKREDLEKLRNIFSTIECDDVVPKAFVRLGRPGSYKPRLLKVMLESVSSKRRLLGGTKFLRKKNGDGAVDHGWSNIYITPDLTKQERDLNRELRMELEHRKINNPNLVIYRGSIMDRKDINGQAGGTSGGGGAHRFPAQSR